MQKLRIALAQINPTVGAFSNHQKLILNAIRKAQGLGVDIIVFPELALCGYPPEDLLFKKDYIADNQKVLKTIVSATEGITAIIGFVDSDKKGNLYNAAAILNNGKQKAVYHKVKLPNYGVFDEKRYFSQGKSSPLFKLGDVTFGVSICEDIWSDASVCQDQVNNGAQFLINISASPYHAGKRNERKKMLANHAKRFKTPICYLNMVGGQDEVVFDGGSFVFNSTGRVLREALHLEEDLSVLDMTEFGKAKRKTRAKIITLQRIEQEQPKIVRSKQRRLSATSEMYNALVLGTRDYVLKNGFKKVVLGLSGGIDSALTATVACDALGSNNVVGVTMPSQFSSHETRSDAELLAQNLGIKLITLPIEKVYNTYETALKIEFHGLQTGIAEENIQARIRGNLLMALSNKFGWLVLTTGNKSETAVGYCTLYGDMAGGFAVLKDVSKMNVYALSEHRNSCEAKEVIPVSTIKRPPTAELRFDQKDQDSLPPYEILDTILELYIEKEKSFDEIVKRIGDRQLVGYVIALVDRNEYKRRQAPPGVKITPKAFGRDRRLPITNRYMVK